jgi:hypothetical protein
MKSEQELWRESLWLRETLVRVVEELERMAADPTAPARHQGTLLNRAQRVRAAVRKAPSRWAPTRFGETGKGERPMG